MTAIEQEMRELLEDVLTERRVTADGSPGLYSRIHQALGRSTVYIPVDSDGAAQLAAFLRARYGTEMDRARARGFSLVQMADHAWAEVGKLAHEHTARAAEELACLRCADATLVLKELDRTFEGRDADGAPGADGSYWLGHGLALRVWYWLHPEKVSPEEPKL